MTSSADDWLEHPALAMIHLAKIAGQIQYHNLKTADMRKEFLCNINDQLQNWRNWCDENLQRCDYDSLLVDQIYLTYHDIVLSLYNKMLLKLLDCELESDGSIAYTTRLLAHSSEVLTIFDRIQRTFTVYSMVVEFILAIQCGNNRRDSDKRWSLS